MSLAVTEIAQSLQPIPMIAKEAANKAFETALAEGIQLERRLLGATFATEDRREGMIAFAEKRKPEFRNRQGTEPRKARPPGCG